MKRQRLKISLTTQERELLEKIIAAEKTSHFDRLKAQALLLVDGGEHGPNMESKTVVASTGISIRSICRVKQAYLKNHLIKDVFYKFPRPPSIKTPKKEPRKRGQYFEKDITQFEGIEFEHSKYRVILTKEERLMLESIVSSGKHTNRKLNRAKILLNVDEGKDGPGLSDGDVSKKLNVSIPTIQRVRKLLVSEGDMEKVLKFQHENAGRLPKIDGTVEATLLATVCSTQPEGYSRWTLRLLADQLVKLKLVDSVSHMTIRNVLKKMNLNLGRKKNG